MRIKKGDTVQVITGAHKGDTGKVVRVFPDKHRVVVEGVNLVKRHKKASGRQQEHGIIEKPASMHVSNVMYVEGSTKVATRVGFEKDASGKKRVTKKSKKTIKK